MGPSMRKPVFALVLVGTAAGTLTVSLAADLRALWQDGDRS